MINKQFLAVFFIAFITNFSFAQRGKDGAVTITALNSIVNEYAVLNIDANVGNTSITVDNNGLNTNGRFSANLSQGDLIMIIQAQGADLTGSFYVDGNGVSFGLPKDSSWGGVMSYNNCGNYELAEVLGVSGSNIIDLTCGLQNNYSAAGKVQIVRMPRYATFTLNNASSIVCDNWNGSKGGIVAIEVDDVSVIDGSINTTGRGFRGGVVDNQSSFGSNDVASSSPILGGEKGESIAGYQNDYNVVGGRYCKGAPANGGGGGNMHNGGGGGGANGGNPLNWIAVGVPSVATANWANAWNLEWSGLAAANSSGGGKGGYTASTNDQNALTLAPNSGAWGGDSRNKQGGYGGRPLDYTLGKLFFGGGGGSGDGNDNNTGGGGAGGGIIFMNCYGTISGTGTLTSNGNNGVNAFGNAPFNGIAGEDGAGGGGAGGTIFIQSTSTINGVNLIASGGEGGDQILTRGPLGPQITEAQGPGGGGSGGYINTSILANTTVNGGIHGTTDSPSLTEFPPNGATSGGNGTAIADLPSFDILVSDVTICEGSTATLNANSIGTLPSSATITWYDAPFNGTVLATGTSFTTPVLNANTTYYVGFCPSTFTKPVNVTTTPSVTPSMAGANQQICIDSIIMAANNPTNGTGTWTLISGAGNIIDPTLFNTTINSLGVGANVFEWTISSPGCTPSQSQVTITVIPAPVADAGIDQTICGNSTQLAANAAQINTTGTWTVDAGSSIIANINDNTSNLNNLSVGLNALIWTVVNPACPAVSDTVLITVASALSIADAGTSQQICSTSTNLNALAPAIGIGTWTLVSGTGIITNANDNASAITGLSAGPNVFEWTISGTGCPSNAAQVTITVNLVNSFADAGTDNTICDNSINLNANAATLGLTGVWTSPQAGISFANPSDQNTLVSNLQDGANTLIWTFTNTIGCPPSSDTVIINSVSPPSQAIAGTDKTICDAFATLSATTPANGIGSWAVISGTGSINNASSATSNVSGLLPGDVVFVWTVSNAPCPASTDTITITVLPPLSPAMAGADFSICTTDYVMNAITPTSGTGTWTLISGNGLIDNVNNANSNISNLQNGVNTFQWTVANGICPDLTDQVNITVSEPASVAVAGEDIETCIQNVQISASTPQSGLGAWTITQGNAAIANPNSPTTTVVILSAGGATFNWTVSSGGCPSTSDELNVVLITGSNAANAGPDVTIAIGDSTSLSGNGGTVISWEPPRGLSCFTCPDPIASPDTTTMYYLVVTDDNGCRSRDSVLVTVDETTGWFLPTAFTPDDNGVNDVLYFYGTGIKEFTLQVFDRWGEKVFETTDEQVGWDGNYKGKAALSGIYVYQLTMIYKSTKVEQVKGNLNLIRN